MRGKSEWIPIASGAAKYRRQNETRYEIHPVGCHMPPRPCPNILRTSHGLPKAIFWKDLAAEFPAKLLISLVGAAGFEPTTCSTQNCRATRLRYTPTSRE